MQTRKSSHVLARIFTFSLLIALGTGTALSQSSKSSQKQLPRGTYSVSCRPYMGTDYRSLPVLVTGVTSTKDEGIQIEKVEVENKSALLIEKLRFNWYLSTQENPEAILHQGRSPLLGIPDGIKSGEVVEILFPVTSFAEAVKSWKSDASRLSGKYLIQVAVSEVGFEDGSRYTLLARNKVKPLKIKLAMASNHANSTSSAQPQTFCPNQGCDASTVEGVPVGYTCISATGQSCTNSANGQSCTSNICRRDTPGPVRPPIQPNLP